MLQPCGISTGLKEHSNRMTPKAYTPKSPSRHLPSDSGPTQKNIWTHRLYLWIMQNLNCVYFFKNIYFNSVRLKWLNSSGSHSGSHHNSSRINSSPLKGLTIVWLHNSWLTTQNIQHLNSHVIHNPLRIKWLSLTHYLNHIFIIK